MIGYEKDLEEFLNLVGPAMKASKNRQITRAYAAAKVIGSFPERFINYRYLVGNNILFYEALIRELSNKSADNQRIHVQNLIVRLKNKDTQKLGKELQIDLEVIIQLLEKILKESVGK